MAYILQNPIFQRTWYNIQNPKFMKDLVRYLNGTFNERHGIQTRLWRFISGHRRRSKGQEFFFLNLVLLLN